MSGLSGTERRAQRAFERGVLAQIVALCAADGAAPAERVEQAVGYYRHAAVDNPVQGLLGRRLRGALAALQAQGLLDPAAPADSLRPSAAGRAAMARAHEPWWSRLLGR